ncbi:large ribosomal subunit protein mL49-like [Corticium candelabrum]|uniref:large ribosomal subunit protein mL49-like n=1 Tax=Corticium candelabrum TaxID=121492 RepID=UPI002E2529C2|nr:large ribosomal subunit protein mL49-like [Corticium candelabrum]
MAHRGLAARCRLFLGALPSLRWQCDFLIERNLATNSLRSSGFEPCIEEQKDLGFFVHRSKNNNLPVYTEFRTGRRRKFTIIRKVEGDLHILANEVRRILPDNTVVQVNETSSSVVIEGLYWKQIMQLLASQGF